MLLNRGRGAADALVETNAMIKDLRSILDGWEYEPGKISVRKIIGLERREKIQTRVDLGLMQFETEGRPDGKRPHGRDSLLDYHEKRLARYLDDHGDDDGFELSPEECREIRHEAYLYHQRFVSLFVLEEFEGVERDSEVTLRHIDLCERYAAEEEDRAALRPYRNYALMMNTRGRAHQAMKRGAYTQAMAIVDAGMASLQPLDDDESFSAETPAEAALLLSLRQEILEQMPGDSLPKLYASLSAAIEQEDYELAAGIRDRIDAAKRRETK